jgi:hypothetical protein
LLLCFVFNLCYYHFSLIEKKFSYFFKMSGTAKIILPLVVFIKDNSLFKFIQ